MLFDSWRVLLALGILAGLINLLARPKNREALGIELPKQLISQPVAFGLGVVALLLIVLSLTSLPTLPLLVLAELFVLLAWTSYQKTKMKQSESTPNEIEQQKRVNAVARGSILRLELGSSLLSLASPKLNSNLVDQLASLRVAVLERLGLTLPPIHIKDNLKLPANTYRIYLRGGIVGEGTVYKDRFMVIDEDCEAGLDGIQEQDPVFGLPVLWITEDVRDAVGKLFVQAMNPISVVMTHLSSIVDRHASELLTREEVSAMLDELHAASPRLVDDVLGKTVSLSRFHRILQSLLEEKVSVKDLSTIIETASDSAKLSVEESVDQIRVTLRRQICANVSTTGLSGQQVIRCVELPEEVESAISNKHLSKEELTEALHCAAHPLISEGLPIVVVSSTTSRRKVKAQVRNGNENVFILSRSEIVPEVDLQVVGIIEPKEHAMTISPNTSITENDKNRTINYAKSLLELGTRTNVIEDRIELGIAEIRTLVGEILEYDSATRLSPFLASAHRLLIKKGIDSSLAAEIVQRIDINSSMSKDEILRRMIQEITHRLPQTIPPPSRDNMEPTVIALVGPTGVGKTTTIAKLATKFRFQQGRSIALVTADTYRVAAVDQLQQYANLFDSTLEIAGTTEQMKQAMALCKSVDIVLIDTAGRSAADGDRIQDTADILQIARPDEVHLVLSAASSLAATKRAVEGFAPMGYDRILVTKLDEVTTPGEMVSTLCLMDKPMSWFTNGQDISTHLDLARPSKLIESIWNEHRPITC